MKQMLKIVAPIVLVIVILAGGYWLYATRFAPGASDASSAGEFTQIVPVREGSLDSSLSVVGELDAVQSEDLAFAHVNGTDKLATLNVAAGNTVTKGQVLAGIDPAPYQQALDQAQSDLAAAEKTLADLKTPVTQLKFSQADLAVAQAQYKVQAAQNALDDLVHPDIAALQSKVADAQSALAQAKSDLLSKQNNKDTAKQLYNLQVAEATPSADYNRLAAETYSDEFYQDRLRVAYNKMMDAQDARVTFEIQQKADLLAAQTKVRTSQQALADAQENLAKAKVGGDKLALAQAQQAVKQAQVDLAQAQSDRADLDAGPDATALAAAQADVDKKQLALANAQAALDGAQLTASFDGTVLKTNLKPGDPLTANTTVLSIANLHNLQVLASVDETTIRRIQQGQTATISFDAFPGQTFQGTVLQVPLQGQLQGDVMVYQVPLSLSGTDKLPLLVGMTANVNIQTDKVENGLLVPTMALQRQNGGYQVLVVDPTNPQGQPVAVPVEVGLSDGTYTQITQGLTPGDQVVVTLQNSTNQSRFFPGGGAVFFGSPGGGFPGGGGSNRNTRTNTGR